MVLSLSVHRAVMEHDLPSGAAMVSCIVDFQFHLSYFSCLFDISERCQPISIARIVIVRVAVAVDITEIIRVARIRRALPPIVG